MARRQSGSETVDLSAFDAAAVLGVIRGIPQTFDLKPMNIDELRHRIHRPRRTGNVKKVDQPI